MKLTRSSLSRVWRKPVATAAMVTTALTATMTGTHGVAHARGHNPFPPHRKCVGAPGGIKCINIRTWKSNADPKTSPTVILLDGLRATWDRSGWEHDTNVQFLANHGINVVEPVGGDSSFYTDWNGPSVSNGQRYTYKWETFLTRNLPPYLDSLGFSRNYSLVGISMGGGAAFTLTAHHPELFRRAASISGFLHTTQPGFPALLRLAMLSQNGYDLNAMWGPPGSPRWAQNDPYILAPALRGKPLWLSAGTGMPSSRDRNVPADQVFNGAVIEIAAKESAVDFKNRADANGVTNVHYVFPPKGVHNWKYWQDQVWEMQKSNWFRS